MFALIDKGARVMPEGVLFGGTNRIIVGILLRVITEAGWPCSRSFWGIEPTTFTSPQKVSDQINTSRTCLYAVCIVVCFCGCIEGYGILINVVVSSSVAGHVGAIEETFDEVENSICTFGILPNVTVVDPPKRM